LHARLVPVSSIESNLAQTLTLGVNNIVGSLPPGNSLHQGFAFLIGWILNAIDLGPEPVDGRLCTTALRRKNSR
jgi:hypothetical protein